MVRILIAHSDVSVAELCRQALDPNEYWMATAGSFDAAEANLSKQCFHVCLVGINGPSDVEPFIRLRQPRPNMAFVALLDSTDTSLTVSLMRMGATDVWVKSDGDETLRSIVSDTISRWIPENGIGEGIDFPYPEFVGRHPRIQEVFQLVMSIKDSESTVLITGESGTGKEVVSKAIHYLGGRKRSPWIPVNCGAIPANLLESELFGHVKGAFTGAVNNRMGRFQMAGQGTLFLDEIGDLPLDLQAKFLRALQSKQFEPVGSAQSQTLGARIVAATNKDLEKAVAEGRFREDLYYRLNVIPIPMPPLRARKSDIPLLVHSFLKRFNMVCSRTIPGVSEEAMRCLVDYHWPGNIRELENLMERVTLLKRNDSPIELKDFPVGYFKNVRLDRFVANVALPDEGVSFDDAVNQFENELILQALQRTAGNRNRAASLLRINRTTLVEKLKRKGLVVS
ncbi:MAG: sigma-54-dependent Fis family transcriptional regulator [Deltaproteobacteria bacterium]|nr:sigma-54-dependent Fis family transcriptional regulator [Deltaproteobacteria bacterium]MBI3295217.1 sigma-54-dependent Fis family transcriptional regulator [Deltaproteobacteria bacterium]